MKATETLKQEISSNLEQTYLKASELDPSLITKKQDELGPELAQLEWAQKHLDMEAEILALQISYLKGCISIPLNNTILAVLQDKYQADFLEKIELFVEDYRNLVYARDGTYRDGKLIIYNSKADKNNDVELFREKLMQDLVIIEYKDWFIPSDLKAIETQLSIKSKAKADKNIQCIDIFMQKTEVGMQLEDALYNIKEHKKIVNKMLAQEHTQLQETIPSSAQTIYKFCSTGDIKELLTTLKGLDLVVYLTENAPRSLHIACKANQIEMARFLVEEIGQYELCLIKDLKNTNKPEPQKLYLAEDGSYIVASKNLYELCLLSSLQDINESILGKIYLAEDGKYCLRKADGKILQGKATLEKAQLRNLKTNLQDKSLKYEILSQIMQQGHISYNTIYKCKINEFKLNNLKNQINNPAFKRAVLHVTTKNRHTQLGVEQKIDEYGYFPLHYAVEAPSLNTIALLTYLIDNGADVNCTGVYGRTPLHTAALLGNLAAVDWLLNNGANINLQETGRMQKNSALHNAAFNNHPEVVKSLLANGANPLLKNYHGKTALVEAIEQGNSKVAKVFFSFGHWLNKEQYTEFLKKPINHKHLACIKIPLKQTLDIIAIFKNNVENQLLLSDDSAEADNAHNQGKDKEKEEYDTVQNVIQTNAYSDEKISYLLNAAIANEEEGQHNLDNYHYNIIEEQGVFEEEKRKLKLK